MAAEAARRSFWLVGSQSKWMDMQRRGAPLLEEDYKGNSFVTTIHVGWHAYITSQSPNLRPIAEDVHGIA